MTLPRKVSRLLVPIDFSDTAGVALEYAAFLAKSFGARVELLHVLDPMMNVAAESVLAGNDGQAESLAERGRHIAEEELGRLADRLERDGVAADSTVETGVPWERVVHAAARADLVVMGTHGRTGLTRVLLGSVTDKVVQRSLTPVLTIRGAPVEPILDARPMVALPEVPS